MSLSSPDGSGSERVLFVGVARVTDGALLASVFVDSKLASQEKQQFERQFLQVCQQQRGAVARALANRPKLVLADEPTGNLDPASAAESLGLIRETCRESGAALLLVSHDREVLGQFDAVRDLAEINRVVAGPRAKEGQP